MSEPVAGAAGAPAIAPANLSVQDAIDRIRERREHPQPAPPAGPPQPDRPPPLLEPIAGEPAGEAGEDPEPEGAAGDADAGPAEPTYRVKVDGQEVEVPLSELAAGYQRARDYTYKTQQLGQERGQVEQARAELLQMQATVRQVLETVRPQLEAELGAEPNWAELAEKDPIGWIAARTKWDETQRKRQAQAQLQQEHRRQAEQHLAQHLERESTRLAERLPGWNDQAQRSRLVEEIRSYAADQLGFSREELQHAYDSRIIEAIWKARQWDALQGGRVQPTPAPGQRPPMSNGAGPPSSVRRARSAFQSDATVDNAVALLQARRQRGLK
jgi:hypothetical protein